MDFNLDDLLEDDPEVRASRVTAAERSRHVLPAEPSGANRLACPPSSYIRIPHLLGHPDLLQKQPGPRAGQTGAGAGRHGQVLARAAPADDVHRRQLRPVQQGDVPHVEHLREMIFCHLDGEGLNLAGPQRSDTVPRRSQRKAANAVKQAPEGQGHFTAWTMVRVVLTAAWAV